VVRIPVLGEHGTLVGRVIDSVTGKPVAKRKVFAYARRDAPRDLQPERRLTDDDGRFRFDVLPVGPTLVYVHGDQRGDDLFVLLPDPSSPYTFASQECTVVKGRETALEFTLLPINAKDANLPTLDFEACVTEAVGGRPIAGARIYVSARVGTTDVEVATFEADADGRARGPVFATEHYSVSVYGPPLPRGTSGPAYVRLVVPCAPTDGVLTVEAALAKVH
jgi:5-hydroxyisourate hydrolase-like protein (transthyretin family)